MVAATSAAAKLLLLRYRHSFSSSRESNNLMSSTKVPPHIPHCFSSTRTKGCFPIRALDPRRPQEDEKGNSQNGLEYLGKVLAGSIVGGAVIKYGSIVFPEITRPNIILALIMIFTPVIVATLLLIKQSRADG